MSVTITSTCGGSQSVDIQGLLAEADRTASDCCKDAKILRRLHHLKNMALLDENICCLKEQQEQLGKAGWFNFFIGMASNFFNIATTALSAIFPPATPIFQAVNQGIQGVLSSLSHINPFTKNAGEAGVDAEEFKKLAEAAQFRSTIEDEHLKSTEETRRIVKNRMEQAIENLQKSQESAVKV